MAYKQNESKPNYEVSSFKLDDDVTPQNNLQQNNPQNKQTAKSDLDLDFNFSRPKSQTNRTSISNITNGANNKNIGIQNSFQRPTTMPSSQNNARQMSTTQSSNFAQSNQRPNNTQPQSANFRSEQSNRNFKNCTQPQQRRYANTRPILDVRNLTKKYGERVAVDNISLQVFPSQIVGFLGVNGAGKSTTIKAITNLAKATSGMVTICGYNINTRFEKAIENVGAMIETPHFYPYLSGYNNLKYYARLSGVKNKQKINEVAALVGLQNRIHDKFSSYSLGMKQRLGIAQALLNDPKLLILDEPTNGLDANGIREIRMTLKQLAQKRGIAILISSHILGEMENLCDVIAIVDKGKMVAFETLKNLKLKYNNNTNFYIKCNAPNYAGQIITEKYGIDVGIAKGQIHLKNLTDNKKFSDIITHLSKNKILIYGAGELDFSLEDMFLQIIGNNSNQTSII